jgi:hypothetical protein
MDFKELQSLIEIFQLPGVLPLKNIKKKELGPTQVQALFDGIEGNEFRNGKEAATALYGSNASDKAYMMMRMNLGDTLVHDLAFYDFSKRFSTLLNKTFSFSRSLIGVRIILATGMHTLAAKLAKRLYDEATEYEVTEIRLHCLRILRENALLTANVQQSEEYSLEFKKVSRLFFVELEVEEECQRIESNYIASAARNPAVADAAFAYEDSLQEIRAHGTSSTIEIYRFRILLFALQISNQFEQAIMICNEARNYLELHPRISTRALKAEFAHIAMTSTIILRDYSQAIEIGRELLELRPKGKGNWYLTLYRMLMAALHNTDYNLALELYRMAIIQNGILKLLPYEQEKWKLCRGYISLFFKTGVVITEDKKLIKEFRLSDFINSLPELTKDKGGLNIPIHVLQILYYLYTKNYSQSSSRINLFKLYFQRYLNEEEYYRTHIFLTMLKLLRKVHYDTDKAEKLCEKYYEELTCTPEKPEQFIEFNEIIPYDVLWQWILKNCKPGRYDVV